MKKIIIAALIVLPGLKQVSAQTNSMLIYGNLNFGYQQLQNETKTIKFGINPGFGYQLDRNSTIGVEGGFNTSRILPKSGEDQFSNEYKIGAFYRYAKPVFRSNLFFIYGQVGAGYKGITNGIVDAPTNTTGNGMYAYAVPAIGLNMGKGWALWGNVGGIEYNSLKMTGETNSSQSFNITFGQILNFGIAKNIGGQKSHRIRE